MKGAGANLDVLLRGNAVNYAVMWQDASGLAFGEKKQTRPPRLEQDLAKLTAKGVKVFLVARRCRDLAGRATDVMQARDLSLQVGHQVFRFEQLS